MNRKLPPLNHFFLRPQISIDYRRQRRFTWATEGVANYGILYVLDGCVQFKVEEVNGELSRHQSLLIQPGRQGQASGQNVESIVIGFSPAFMLDYAARARLAGSGAPTFDGPAINADERLTQMFTVLAQEMAADEAGKDIIVSALTEQVAIHLLRRYSKMRKSDELELSRVGLIDRRIRRAVEFMQAHLDQELPLKEIAAASYLSPFHFSRLFKKLTGATPHSYLAALRTARAKSLLAETDLSVSEIAARVGYATPSHFAKAFRQATGLAPGNFRASVVGR